MEAQKIEREDVGPFHTAPEDHGQIVEYSYAATPDYLVVRIHDRSDRSESYYAVAWEDVEGDGFEPWNGAPRYDEDDMVPCVVDAAGRLTVGDPEPPTEPVGYVEWEAVAGYVACCYGPDGDEPGDCYTRVGQDEAGWWWVDDGDDTQRDETYGPFAGGDDARAKAAEVAEERDESDIAEERTADAERRRAEEEREEERRFREEEEARRAEEIDNIPGAREPVWIAVNMDGGRVHGPGTYAEIDATVQRELAAFRDSRACGDRSYLPRSIVRSDRGVRRAGHWSTRWINS